MTRLEVNTAVAWLLTVPREMQPSTRTNVGRLRLLEKP